MFTIPECPQPVSTTRPRPRTLATSAWSSRISGSGSQCPWRWAWWAGKPALELGRAVDLAGDQQRAVEQERRLPLLDDVEARRPRARCGSWSAARSARGPGIATRRRLQNSGWIRTGSCVRPSAAASPCIPVVWSQWPWLSTMTSMSPGESSSRRMFSISPSGVIPVSNSTRVVRPALRDRRPGRRSRARRAGSRPRRRARAGPAWPARRRRAARRVTLSTSVVTADPVDGLRAGSVPSAGNADSKRTALCDSLAAGASRAPDADRTRRAMSDYAVVNPATGETVKTYPTISDDELKDAIGRADAAHRDWGASTTVEERAALIAPRRRAARRAARAARRDHRARDGQADRAGARRGRLQRRDLRVLRRQRGQAAGRRADRAARRRGLGVHPPQPRTASCSGSCRGTSPTTRWRASPARTWRSATRSCSSTRRSARSRPRRWSRSSTRPASRRTPTSTSTRPTSRSSG